MMTELLPTHADRPISVRRNVPAGSMWRTFVSGYGFAGSWSLPIPRRIARHFSLSFIVIV